MHASTVAATALSALGTFHSAAAPSVSPARDPFAVVLGTAQDGGLPQLGGAAPEDEAARRDPERRRLVASLLIVDPASGERFLIDATPDIREQVDAANRIAPRPKAASRPPLFEAIALTHAHVGHYAGLMHLGREAYGASGQRILASERMAHFLETNGPWDLLVKLKHITIERFEADKPVALNSAPHPHADRGSPPRRIQRHLRLHRSRAFPIPALASRHRQVGALEPANRGRDRERRHRLCRRQLLRRR